MAKIFFTIAPPPGEVLAKAREVGISLSKEQSDFIRDHSTHAGLTVTDKKVMCRTCGASA